MGVSTVVLVFQWDVILGRGEELKIPAVSVYVFLEVTLTVMCMCIFVCMFYFLYIDKFLKLIKMN